MAKLLTELTEHVLSCGVCLEPFSEGPMEARLLPCRHSFCLGCLQQLQEGNTLTCPKCRTIAEVPGSVERSFPKDLGLMNTVDFILLKKKSASIPCGDCDTKANSTHSCQTCHSFLCAQCVRDHLRLKYLRSHSLVPVEDLLQSPEAYFSEPELCPKHEGARLDLHCSSPGCCTAVCKNCAITSHKGDNHQLEDLADVVQREKGDNRALCAQLQERRAQLGKMEEAVTSAKSSTIAQKEDILRALGETFDTILHAVTSRRQQIEEKLEEASASQVSRHDSNMAAVGHSVAEVEATAGYLARIAASAQPVQFLALHRAQTSSVSQLLASPVCPPCLDLRPRQLKLDTTGLQRVLDFIHAFADVTDTADTDAQSTNDVMENCNDMDDIIHTHDAAVQAFATDDVSTQTPQVMTQSTATDTLRMPTADSSIQTETAGLREIGSQTETPTDDVSTQTPQVMTQSTATDTLRMPTADSSIQTETAGLRETGSQTEPPTNNVSTQTAQVMTQSTGTDTLRMPTADSSIQTETAGLRETGSQSETSPVIQFPDFALCGGCLNTGACQLSDGVLTNSGEDSTTQSAIPHTHPVCSFPHSLSPPSPSPVSFFIPSYLNLLLSPASVLPQRPQFHRLKKIWGTLGRVVLKTGLHYWEVTASFQGEGRSNCFLMEMGVLTPGEQDEKYCVLPFSQTAWGVRVRRCVQHASLCVHGVEGTQEVCHIQMMSLPTPDRPMKIRVGLLLDVETRTLVCLDATRGVRFCTLHNLRPPLSPFFVLRPKSWFIPHSKYDICVRVETGDRTTVDRGLLERLKDGGDDDDDDDDDDDFPRLC